MFDEEFRLIFSEVDKNNQMKTEIRARQKKDRVSPRSKQSTLSSKRETRRRRQPVPGCWKSSITKLEKLAPHNKRCLLANINSAGWSGPGTGTKCQRAPGQGVGLGLGQPGDGRDLSCFAPEPPLTSGWGPIR